MSVLCFLNFTSSGTRMALHKMRSIKPQMLYSTIVNTNNHYDIIIAGGGMIGTTLACTLGKNLKLSSKRILLLEGNKELRWENNPKYSNRVSSINPSTQKLLERLGAWKFILDVRCAVVKKLQVWDALSDAMITFNHDNLSDNVAYIVENDLLLAAVGKELKTASNVALINEAKIKTYKLPTHEEKLVNVELENGPVFTCELLLGCDGANSKVRQEMGVQYLSWDYEQMGVVATLELSEVTNNIVAWQRFLPTGPIALLPLTESLCSLVWSTSPDHAKTLLNMSDQQFVDSVNDAIWKVHKTPFLTEQTTKAVDGLLKLFKVPSNAIRQLPPSIKKVDDRSRAAFPLGFGHATRYVKRGVALVGDAAHRLHPLAGQGVNLGFGDVICLNDKIEQAVYSGSSVGSWDYLKSYEQDRQGHNIPTMLAVHGLHKLYNTSFTPLVALRSMGLQITHALTPLKKAIINQAAH